MGQERIAGIEEGIHDEADNFIAAIADEDFLGLAADVFRQGCPQFFGKGVRIVVRRRLGHAFQEIGFDLGEIKEVVRTFIGIDDRMLPDFRDDIGFKRADGIAKPVIIHRFSSLQPGREPAILLHWRSA